MAFQCTSYHFMAFLCSFEEVLLCLTKLFLKPPLLFRFPASCLLLSPALLSQLSSSLLNGLPLQRLCLHFALGLLSL